MEENKNVSKDIQELDESKLEAVVGGMPEYFVVGSEKYTPEQVIELAEKLKDDFGPSYAHEFLENVTEGYPAIHACVVDFYKVYGKNTFGAMKSKGF